jgi:hypothetical protein
MLLLIEYYKMYTKNNNILKYANDDVNMKKNKSLCFVILYN